MRIEISHKFIMGFIIVVGSVVLLGTVVPHLGIPGEWQQLFSVSCALLIGLILGGFFPRPSRPTSGFSGRPPSG